MPAASFWKRDSSVCCARTPCLSSPSAALRVGGTVAHTRLGQVAMSPVASSSNPKRFISSVICISCRTPTQNVSASQPTLRQAPRERCGPTLAASSSSPKRFGCAATSQVFRHSHGSWDRQKCALQRRCLTPSALPSGQWLIMAQKSLLMILGRSWGTLKTV